MEDIEGKYEALSYKKDKRAASSSKYRGVSLNKDRKSKPWLARISIDGKSKYLGTYATEEEAARAHDAEGARWLNEKRCAVCHYDDSYGG